MSPEIVYSENKRSYSSALAAVEREKRSIGNIRLALVVITMVLTVLLFRSDHQLASGGVLTAGTLLFIALVLRHAVVLKRAVTIRALVAINRQGEDRCAGRWSGFSETGADFSDVDHPYTADLDIFGSGSLFQYCCTAHTAFGRELLALMLSGTNKGGCAGIKERQEAVDELAPKIQWRQQYECCGYDPVVAGSPLKLIAWGEDASVDAVPSWLKPVVVLLQVGALVSAGMVFLTGGWILPCFFAIALQISLTVVLTPQNLHCFDHFDRNSRGLSVYGTMLSHIAGEQFSTRLLKQEQAKVAGQSGAALAMRGLSSIIAASEIRYSPLPWLIVNALFMWDIRCVLKLAAWKKRNGTMIRTWLDVIGTYEAFSSTALLLFEHPSWSMPIVEEGLTAFTAVTVGHPLLPSLDRIDNNFEIGPPGGAFSLITGSNMSGKSTFLRAIGINMVLAYAGAPVCASSLRCGVFAIFTSMRTGDDLLSHVSTFYAELLRVKKIVDAANKKIPLFFLLDELFRGTNSADRHDGAVALLEELSAPHTLGCVATHDLELCSLADNNPQVANYHFKEWYQNNEIRFDYCLREGPSTTRNALYLMRKLGITRQTDEAELSEYRVSDAKSDLKA